MRLPNGYGSVHKLPGKRRNPWRVRKTVTWDKVGNDGKPLQEYMTIGYYPTKQQALQALAEYNSNPYDISTDSITFSEVYEKWSAEHFQNIVQASRRTWMSAYTYCVDLYDMRMRDIRTHHLEGVIKNADVGSCTKQRMKSLFNLIYRYAMKHEIVDKNYAELCNSVKGRSSIIHTPFSDEEIQTLWDHLEFPFIDMVLIGIYSGWRPQELAILKLKDIDLENRTMFGGLKTDAGKNRTVPIHSKIFDLVKARYDHAVSLNSIYLFNDEISCKFQGKYEVTYDKYRRRFEKINKEFKLNHRPHDTRHTFITLAKKVKMDEYILKLIVGHEIADVTEKIYTHRTVNDLKKEIEKIK